MELLCTSLTVMESYGGRLYQLSRTCAFIHYSFLLIPLPVTRLVFHLTKMTIVHRNGVWDLKNNLFKHLLKQWERSNFRFFEFWLKGCVIQGKKCLTYDQYFDNSGNIYIPFSPLLLYLSIGLIPSPFNPILPLKANKEHDSYSIINNPLDLDI